LQYMISICADFL